MTEEEGDQPTNERWRELFILRLKTRVLEAEHRLTVARINREGIEFAEGYRHGCVDILGELRSEETGQRVLPDDWLKQEGIISNQGKERE